MMRKLLFFFWMALPLWIQAQTASIRGQVVDATSGESVEYADVVVTNLNDQVVASGIVSQGAFLLEKVPAQEVLVMVRMMGYDPFVSDKLSLKTGQDINLGIIKLSQLSVGLSEVTVVGEKNQIVYKLDRQSISGSSSATAGGGTAIDVLANTPSVQVSPEGAVTFRGSSNFLVYVDGIPSPLEGADALRQIAAATIEDIEIITTPSARYKTDGDVGIINVTTKRAKVSGWSGVVNLSGSTLGTGALDATLNFQTKHHNFYIGTSLQDIAGKSDFSQQKTTLVQGIQTTSLSEGERWSDAYTRLAKAGWQFADGARHNLSLDFQYGQTDNWRGGDMVYDETRKGLDTGAPSTVHNVFTSHDRYELLKNLFQASLNYVFRINDKSEAIATSRFRYDWGTLEYTESNMFDKKGDRYEGTRGYEEEHHWDCDASLTYKLNYSPSGKFEAGYQYTTYSEHGGYRIKYWDREQQAFEWQEDLATPFFYRRQVHSLYGMVTDKIGRVSFDAGLRADRVLDKLEIQIAHADRDIKRFNVFPSAHLDYDAGRGGTFNLGYSYRTNRPGIWNLEPYITYEDYYTKKIGNPDINPEFIHSLELGWRKSFSGGNSLAVTGYLRHRKDLTDWVRRPYEPGVTLDSIVNAGNQVEKGFELSLVLKPVERWTSTLNGSLFHYDFTAKCPLCTDRCGWYY
ncbi:MAG: TonB-dependent receptor, partial [Bacteroidaceae bacterium]|nr:TonB-dependent receptor [Bacteroidaceae bacterium]